MAHPMQLGMMVKNYHMGMKVKGLGMRVTNYGEHVANYGERVSNYGERVVGLGQPQMGDVFSDVLNSLQSSIGKTLTQAQNNAISSALKTVVADPTVQQAVVASGNDAAIANLATQLKSAQNAAVANPITTALLVGGLGLGALFLFKAITK